MTKFKKGHKHSDETKKKIGDALRNQIQFNCDYCSKLSSEKPSSFNKKKRHFCSMKCFALYRKEILPKEEQPRYGTGADNKTVKKKVKARTALNHAIRDGFIDRKPCIVCGNENSEGHHEDYDKPLEVIWLCFKHHREHHKNSELVKS